MSMIDSCTNCVHKPEPLDCLAELDRAMHVLWENGKPSGVCEFCTVAHAKALRRRREAHKATLEVLGALVMELNKIADLKNSWDISPLEISPCFYQNQYDDLITDVRELLKGNPSETPQD